LTRSAKVEDEVEVLKSIFIPVRRARSAELRRLGLRLETAKAGIEAAAAAIQSAAHGWRFGDVLSKAWKSALLNPPGTFAGRNGGRISWLPQRRRRRRIGRGAPSKRGDPEAPPPQTPIARQRIVKARGGGGRHPSRAQATPTSQEGRIDFDQSGNESTSSKSIGGGGSGGQRVVMDEMIPPARSPRLSSLLGSCHQFSARLRVAADFPAENSACCAAWAPAAQLPSNSNTLVCLALGAADSALYTVTEYRRSPSQTVKNRDQIVGDRTAQPDQTQPPQRDILHRILRPSSLFVTGDGQVKLADYLADWKLKDLFGLPQAARPLVIGRGNKRTDVYARWGEWLRPCTGDRQFQASMRNKKQCVAIRVLVLELHLGRYLEKGVDVSLPPDLCRRCCATFSRLLPGRRARGAGQRWTAQQLRQHPLLSTKPLQPVVGDVAAVATSMPPPLWPTRTPPPPPRSRRSRRLRPLRQNWLPRRHRRAALRLWAADSGMTLRLTNGSDVIKKILREVRLLSPPETTSMWLRYYYSWLEDEIGLKTPAAPTSASNPRDRLSRRQSNRLEAVNASDSPSFVSPTKQQADSDGESRSSRSRTIPAIWLVRCPRAAGQFVCCSRHPGLALTFGDESSDSGSSEDSSEEEDEQQLSSIGEDSSGDIIRAHNVYGHLQDDGDNGEEGDDWAAWCSSAAPVKPPGSSAAVDKADKVSAAGATGEAEANGILASPLDSPAGHRQTDCRETSVGLGASSRSCWKASRHIHRCDIIHRDLKAVQNIGDFGLATTRLHCGWPALRMPPPRLRPPLCRLTSRRRRLHDRVRLLCTKVDMYSLGVIFFEMTPAGHRHPRWSAGCYSPTCACRRSSPAQMNYGAAAGAEAKPGSSGDRLRKKRSRHAGEPQLQVLLNCLFSRRSPLPEDHAFDVDMCRPTPSNYLGKDGDVLGLPATCAFPTPALAARAGVQSARRYAIDRVVREADDGHA
uniref:Protein kinase domain-containing protein n=1 Tax=Macrostomum lignano TaxID=282301 RepID=A0A1I8JQT7_9PLAT